MKITQKLKLPTETKVLNFPRVAPIKPSRYKKEYVSSPTWFPKAWREAMEENLWDCAKLHDNDRGNRGVIPKKEADAIFCQLVRYRGYSKGFAWAVGVYLRVWGK